MKKADYEKEVHLKVHDIENHWIKMTENCFHHVWDTVQEKFYYKKCMPIRQQQILILDMINYKIISVDDEDTYESKHC